MTPEPEPRHLTELRWYLNHTGLIQRGELGWDSREFDEDSLATQIFKARARRIGDEVVRKYESMIKSGEEITLEPEINLVIKDEV